MSENGQQTSTEFLLECFAEYGNEIAFVHGEDAVGYRDLTGRVYRFARALEGLGARAGERIVLLGANSVRMRTARLAANLLGCTVSELYAGLAPEAKARIVTDLEARFLVVDAGFGAEAERVLEHVSVDVLGLGEPFGTDLCALAAAESAEPLGSRARPEDIQQIRHTGGTTGHPKGICYRFDNWQPPGKVLIEQEDEQYTPRQLVCTTLAHAAGGLADRTLSEGGVVFARDGFDAGEVLATIERERITDLFLLPPLIYRLLDHPDIGRTDLSSLRRILYGGCKADPTRMATAVRVFGPVFTQFYGQTEAGLVSVLGKEEHTRPELLGTAGKVSADVGLRILDERQNPVPEGERGELWVCTGHEMAGYWRNPELTAQTIVDGWVRTGDVGYLDAEGYLHVVDRVKDMIVVVGGHVYCSEIESLLLSSPGVRAATVFGTPDPDGAELVNAAVVADERVSGDELIELVVRHKGTMYRPALVRLLDEIPLTDVGKPDKNALRKQLLTSI
ncbi:AMP-binding protein [Sciscionella marina]|uniref:AMP-binding protein n=1 Tax=Sciscionella marina TaxID=508770 RepID=UPI00036AB518|nr:AMP-binding protein [Sciscionella marina]